MGENVRSFFLTFFPAIAIFKTVVPAGAQLPEGIGVGLTPTVERIEWGDDVLLEDATLPGGRVSLNFGRYVALQGYYLWQDGVDLRTTGFDDAGAENGNEVDINRRGADVVLTMANTPLTPFARFGGAVLEVEGGPAGDSEHLAAVLGGGIRLDLSDRLQTQIFVQDVAFRANRAAFLDNSSGEGGPTGDDTFHNLSYGAGINLYLGGESVQPETDEALLQQLQGGLGGVAIPIEVFAGQLQFDDDLELDDQNVAGARVGLNLGPYVGLRGYYLRGVNDDLDDFEDFDGWGGEAIFNLNRGEGFTPYLVVGLGRLDFTGRQVEQARLTDDEKWTATAGVGLALNLSPRIRLEASARDLLLAQGDVEEVTSPDELRSNWLFSGGLRFAIGGSTADGGVLENVREEERARSASEREARIERLERELAAIREEELDREEHERIAIVEGDTLERRPVARGETIELPVLEEGEIYIRFGESGTFERVVPSPMIARVDGDSVVRLEVEGETLPEERLAAALDRIDRRLADIDSRLERVEGLDGEMEADVQVEVEAPPDRDLAPRRGPREEPAVQETIEPDAEERSEPGRGVFNGEPMRLVRLGGQTGSRFNDPQQILLGLHADVGSAFGGAGRFVPELSMGFANDVSLTLNAHIQWPIDYRWRGIVPYVGTGLGIFAAEGETDLLIPNLILGGFYAMNQYQPFVAYQALDLFDDNHLLIGIRRF